MAVGVTERGSAHAGRRRADKPANRRSAKPLHLALLSLGVLAGGTVWFFLVRAAIDFGQAGRDGESLAWAICGAATVGAAGCLLLVFVLVARIWHGLGVRSGPRPPRLPGGRRASR